MIVGNDLTFSVTEDSSTFAMLLDALLAGGDMQPPIDEGNIGIYTELARKYDINSLEFSCDLFVSERNLSLENVVRWYKLADEYHMRRARAACRAFVADGHYREMEKCPYPIQFANAAVDL